MHLKPNLLRGLAAGAVMLGMAAPAAQAQTADRKTAISGNVGLLQYNGNMGSDFWNRSGNDLTVGGGGTITRYLSPSFDLALMGYAQSYQFSSELQAGNNFQIRGGMADLGIKLKLNNGKILKEDAFIQPYLMGGGGMFMFNSEGRANGSNFRNEIRRPEVFGMAGLRFRLSEVVGLDLSISQHYPFTERVDNLYGPANPADKLYDRFMLSQAGITVALGKMKDEDKDGVSDKKDKCPGTPAGVAVDPNGCPLDKDGDGVPDYQDKCPDVKGLAALQGCPDRDGDGVTDADDACPDTPGKAELKGCPDADNDGVIDQNDKCPGTPAGVSVDANGCPLDKDGDGVPDYQDRCPDRAGPASNKGCPEIKAEAKKILNEATKYINFDFNKATLKASSYPKLEQMVQILNEYPDYSLSIAGHTDSKGADNFNLGLSYERANSARAYMLSKGIPAERIEARGYGETKPIADNAKAAGQAMNRRVDFDPFLTGETNAAEVKYGPAPTITEIKSEGKKVPTRKAAVKKATMKKAPVRKAPAKRK